MQNVVIVTDGLFGLEVFSILEESNKWYAQRNREQGYHIDGFVFLNDGPDAAGTKFPAAVLGTVNDWVPTEGVSIVLGVKDPARKRMTVQFLREKNVRFETVIAPWMLAFDKWLNVGEGCIVALYSAKPGLEIGNFATVIHSMLSGHKIGEYSTVMRYANIAGDSIGNDCFVGDHVFLAVGRSIGDRCVVEPGSLVVKNLKPGTHAGGVPAKSVREK
ncbi:MAG: hypothetical protein J6Y10_00265 [Lachnospiraceae bacterium]|nr:hypothetical protein [Lachnospiraceae bacterium]